MKFFDLEMDKSLAGGRAAYFSHPEGHNCRVTTHIIPAGGHDCRDNGKYYRETDDNCAKMYEFETQK